MINFEKVNDGTVLVGKNHITKKYGWFKVVRDVEGWFAVDLVESDRYWWDLPDSKEGLLDDLCNHYDLKILPEKVANLYDQLCTFYCDNDETARKIIIGGYEGYCYGGCGYVFIDDADDSDYISQQKDNMIEDAAFGKVLIGGMI